MLTNPAASMPQLGMGGLPSGCAPAVSSSQQQLMMLSNGVVVPVPAGQTADGALPTGMGAPMGGAMGVASQVHSAMFCGRDMMSSSSAQRSSSKNCNYPGCMKGAIGKLKLCIAHGGGKRCTVPGCNKAAQGQQPLCKAHGGGRRCQFPGCPRSARDRTDLCIGHGGGKRCSFVGCSTSARSGTLYCSLHDGVVKKHTVRMGASTDVGMAPDVGRAEPQLARNGNGVYGYMAPSSVMYQ